MGSWGKMGAHSRLGTQHVRHHPSPRPRADQIGARHRAGVQRSPIPRAAGAHRAPGTQRGQRAGHRRDRHRQGAGGAPYPRPQRTLRRPVRRGQLRCLRREPGGERAVRPREGRLYRCVAEQGRLVRGGQRRHPVPRRDRRPAAEHPGRRCACCRNARWCGSVRAGRSPSTCGWWRRPTSTWPTRWSPDTSARTCSTACTWRPSNCRRCASAAAISCRWPSTSSSSTAGASATPARA